MKHSNHLPEVRDQYEDLPYPPRDPADERHRLVQTWLDDLRMINHYCFAGRQTFCDGFRILIAGGGTGDAALFLGEQLRGTNASIVQLDFSRASLDIARARAEARGLNNIEWVHESLLELPRLGLGRFDYINCSGVLHHLADPDAGLGALADAMADDGALGLMVYGTHGRTGVYQMQELLRMVNDGEADPRLKAQTAREVLSTSPPSNWFRRGEDLFIDHREGGDAALYDLFLHSQDRAYTVDEVYDWIEGGHGLHIRFTDVGRGEAPYLPHYLAGPSPAAYLAKVRAMPLRRQHAIAELLGGALITHSFYATRSADVEAPYGDADYVPFLYHEPVTGEDLARLIEQNQNRPFVLNHAHSRISVHVDPGKWARHVLRLIDGKHSFGEIFDAVRKLPHAGTAALTDAELFADLRPFHDALRAIDRLLLRHRSVN